MTALNLGIWKSRNLGSKKSKKSKFSKSKSVSPKMSTRSGLVGKNSSRPYFMQFQAIFCMGRKNRKNAEILPIFLGGPMGPIHPVWGNGCNISSAIRNVTSHCHPWSLQSLIICVPWLLTCGMALNAAPPAAMAACWPLKAKWGRDLLGQL